jgi:gas vesicle protein
MSAGKVLVGVIAGAAVGALVGVLFAPDKGSETRKKISKKSNDTMDELKEKMEEMLDVLTHKFQGAKNDLGNMVDKEMKKAEDLKQSVKNTMS